jgi:hypothetical protein
LKSASYYFVRFVWWLYCLLLKEGPSAFAALGDCSRCFLWSCGVCGFSCRWPASIWIE